MSVTETDRLRLPFIDAGQAQKELVHNEALLLLDLLVQPAVLDVGLNTAPEAPAEGDRWIVGTDPTGAWSSHAAAIAGWTEGGWRFVPPVAGMRVWNRADGVEAMFLDGAWISGTIFAGQVKVSGNKVLGDRQPAISDPVGGSGIDAEARSAIGDILQTMRMHGLIFE